MDVKENGHRLFSTQNNNCFWQGLFFGFIRGMGKIQDRIGKKKKVFLHYAFGKRIP
jgi:regulation of enolase protein 1 (concanavalin A-like superfamily)